MYSLVMLAGILLGQEQRRYTDIDHSRNDFNMIQEDIVVNRLAEGTELRSMVIKKSQETIKEYSNNEPLDRAWLSKRKVIDWIYLLPEITDGLSKYEKDEINSIISEELFNVVTSELKIKQEKLQRKVESKPISQKKKEVVNSGKYWFWATYNNNRVLLYGWDDPVNSRKLYNLDEQLPDVRAVLQPQPQQGFSISRGWP